MNQYADVSTVEVDGKRKWLYPLVAKGRWLFRRKIVAYFLIAYLLILPWTTINGRQAFLIDLFNAKLYFFGLTYYANEGIVVFAFLVSLLGLILLLTALFGRIFCGWACPQTVFMEFVFRPIERFFEKSGIYQKRFHALPLRKRLPKKILKLSIFAGISFIISNTLVAYFSGAHHLPQMMADGPLAHQTVFTGMLILWGIVMFQFSWFREQVCTFVCPYGRLQSVLLDPHSIIVAYDEKRGEPRGKVGQVTGDCVDCKMCIKVCPTGIDIRKGLQLECVHCTQCMDACDSIMTKLKRPLGLIRYDTEAAMEGKPKRIFRPRLLIYAALLFLGASLILSFGIVRDSFSVTLHREFSDQLFTRNATQNIINPLRIHIQNRSDLRSELFISPVSPKELQIIIPQKTIILAPQEKLTVHFLAELPAESFKTSKGFVPTKVKFSDKQGFEKIMDLKVFGPSQ